jgi:class 3 adenylate cyclase
VNKVLGTESSRCTAGRTFGGRAPPGRKWWRIRPDEEDVAETTNARLDFLDGVGIATDDEVIFGTVGDDRFRDFTIIGQAVNLATELVNEARGDDACSATS